MFLGKGGDDSKLQTWNWKVPATIESRLESDSW